MGERLYKQEYFNDFSDPIEAVFSHSLIMQALSDTIDPLFE